MPWLADATAGNQQATLSWEAIPAAAFYRVKRATAENGPFTTIVTGVVQFREMAAHPADVNLRTICLIAVPCIMNAGAMLLYSKYVMPSSVLIDKHGVVRDVAVGFELGQVKRTEQLIQALLKEP